MEAKRHYEGCGHEITDKRHGGPCSTPYRCETCNRAMSEKQAKALGVRVKDLRSIDPADFA